MGLARRKALPGPAWKRRPQGKPPKLTARHKEQLRAALPDGRSARAGVWLADNGSFVFYNYVGRTRRLATVGGELVLTDLAATDVTGELRWTSGNLPDGLHPAAHDTVLLANGCRYEGGVSPLPNGAVTVSISGGDLPAELLIATTVDDGTAAPAGDLRKFVPVNRRGVPLSGMFRATFYHAGTGRSARGAGVFLPKSNSAAGFFKGITEGGKIGLTGVGP